MTKEYRTSFSAVRKVSCAVGRSQRALMEEIRVLMRIFAEAKERPKITPPSVMMVEEVANQPTNKYAEVMDPSVESDGTSIIDVTMGLGSILFKGHRGSDADGNQIGGSTIGTEGVQNPIGYEEVLADLLGGEESRAVTRGQAAVSTLSKAHIR